MDFSFYGKGSELCHGKTDQVDHCPVNKIIFSLNTCQIQTVYSDYRQKLEVIVYIGLKIRMRILYVLVRILTAVNSVIIQIYDTTTSGLGLGMDFNATCWGQC